MKKEGNPKAEVHQKKLNAYIGVAELAQKYKKAVSDLANELPIPARQTDGTGVYGSAYSRMADKLLDKYGITPQETAKSHPKSKINPDPSEGKRVLNVDPRTLTRRDVIKSISDSKNIPSNLVDEIAAATGDLVWKDSDKFEKTVDEVIPALDEKVSAIATRLGIDTEDAKKFAEDKKGLLMRRANEFEKQLREKFKSVPVV